MNEFESSGNRCSLLSRPFVVLNPFRVKGKGTIKETMYLVNGKLFDIYKRFERQNQSINTISLGYQSCKTGGFYFYKIIAFSLLSVFFVSVFVTYKEMVKIFY